MNKLAVAVVCIGLTACGDDNGDSKTNNSLASLSSVTELSVANDSFLSAQLVAMNVVVSGNVNDDTDQYDIYQFPVLQGDSLTIGLTGGAQSDLDLYLYDSNQTEVEYSENDWSTEEISYQVPSAGIMYVSVEYFDGPESQYKLSISNEGTSVAAGYSEPNFSDVYDSNSYCVDAVISGVQYVVIDDGFELGQCAGSYVSYCTVTSDDAPATDRSRLHLGNDYVNDFGGHTAVEQALCSSDPDEPNEHYSYTIL